MTITDILFFGFLASKDFKMLYGFSIYRLWVYLRCIGSTDSDIYICIVNIFQYDHTLFTTQNQRTTISEGGKGKGGVFHAANKLWHISIYRGSIGETNISETWINICMSIRVEVNVNKAASSKLYTSSFFIFHFVLKNNLALFYELSK